MSEFLVLSSCTVQTQSEALNLEAAALALWLALWLACALALWLAPADTGAGTGAGGRRSFLV